MRLQPVMDLYARRSLRSQERMIRPVCLAQTNIEVVVIHWSTRERLARRQRHRHRDCHHWMRRSTLSPGERWLQEFSLQRYWLRIFGGDAFQIPCRRVARSTVPAKVRLTRFRVPCHNFKIFVAPRAPHIKDGLMKEVPNIADLLGRESKARHP